MREELRRYLMGIPTIDAWHRDAILNHVEKTYEKKLRTMTTYTIFVTNAVILGTYLILKFFIG